MPQKRKIGPAEGAADVSNSVLPRRTVSPLSLLASVPLIVSIVGLPFFSGPDVEASLLTSIQALTFVVLTSIAVLKKDLKVGIRFKAFVLLSAGVLGAALFSTTFSEDLSVSVPLFVQWVWLAAIAALTFFVVGDLTYRELIVTSLSISVFAQVLWSYFDWWGGGSVLRLHSGTFYAPNQYSGYVLLIAPLFLSIFLSKTSLLRVVTFGFLTTVIYLSIAFSGSRGGMVAASLGFITTALLISRGRVRIIGSRLVPLLIVALGVYVLSVSSVAPTGSRVVLTKARAEASASDRLYWMNSALEIGISRLATGTGLGTFGDVLFQRQKPEEPWSKFAHNHYLESFSDGGVPMLVSVGAIAFLPLIAGLRRFRRGSDPSRSQLVAGLAGGLSGAASHLVVDHDWSYPAFAVAFIVMASIFINAVDSERMNRIGRPLRVAFGTVSAIAFFSTTSILLSASFMSRSNDEEAEALRRFERATSLAPWDTVTYFATVEILTERKDVHSLNKAVHLLERARRVDELDPVIHWELASINGLLGRDQEARAAYRRAIRIVPNAPLAYLRAASFEIARSERQIALSILNEGIHRFGGSESLAKDLISLRDRAGLK